VQVHDVAWLGGVPRSAFRGMDGWFEGKSRRHAWKELKENGERGEHSALTEDAEEERKRG
jgi:hypothetical protein